MPSACPTAERWKGHLDGTLPEGVQAELTAHLDQCPSCQQMLERVAAGGESLLDVARQVGQGTDASVVAPGDHKTPTTQALETQAEGPPSPAPDGLEYLQPSR